MYRYKTMEKFSKYFKINSTTKGVYDIELQNLDGLRNYSSIECHVLVYPFSRNINSDNILCNPFEEYLKDIHEGYSSTYSKVSFAFNKIFGILLGLIIFFLFLILWPEAFLSIDSVVAIFAAYIIGKELGDDLESFLVNVSKTWKLQFYKDYFSYKLVRPTALTYYAYYAKRYRYGKDAILPTKMNFEKKSNSEVVRLKFKPQDFKKGDNAHILSIKICDELRDEFEKQGYILAFKICLNKEKILFLSSTEIFQSIRQGEIGCLDKNMNFIKDSVFSKKVFKRSRIKLDFSEGILKGQIIEC